MHVILIIILFYVFILVLCLCPLLRLLLDLVLFGLNKFATAATNVLVFVLLFLFIVRRQECFTFLCYFVYVVLFVNLSTNFRSGDIGLR